MEEGWWRRKGSLKKECPRVGAKGVHRRCRTSANLQVNRRMRRQHLHRREVSRPDLSGQINILVKAYTE